MCTTAQWDQGVFAAVYYLPLLASFPNRSSFGALLQNYQSASARPQITILMSALLVAILSGLWLFCGWNCPQPPCLLTTKSYHHHLGSLPVKEWFSCQGIRGLAKSLYFSGVEVSDQHSPSCLCLHPIWEWSLLFGSEYDHCDERLWLFRAGQDC